MKQRIDPFTKEKFIPKRKNQVFATAKNRVAFHNENEHLLRSLKSSVDKQLKKNFLILSELGIPDGESKDFKRDELLIKGFNPQYFTNFHFWDELNNEHLDIIQSKNYFFRCLYHFWFIDYKTHIVVFNKIGESATIKSFI